MTVSLKEYAVVGYFSEEDAKKALKIALGMFKRNGLHARELSYCDGNIVYLHAATNREKAIMENFLLKQHGAQPRGCLCKA